MPPTSTLKLHSSAISYLGLIVEHNIVNTSPTAFIKRKLDELTPAQRNEYYSLSYVLPGQDISRPLSESEKALAIFQTNGIQAGDEIGLFPRTARLNHGCSSAFNAVYSWREKEGVLVVHALKSIKAQDVRFFLLFYQSSCFQNVDGKH